MRTILVCCAIISIFLLSGCTLCYQFAPTPYGFFVMNQCTGTIDVVPFEDISKEKEINKENTKPEKIQWHQKSR